MDSSTKICVLPFSFFFLLLFFARPLQPPNPIRWPDEAKPPRYKKGNGVGAADRETDFTCPSNCPAH